MKNTYFVSAVAAMVLVLGLASCAPMKQTAADPGYYDAQPQVASTPTRILVEDPYHPGATILMERDAFTGRYYPVSSNSVYGSSTYGGAYGGSAYGAPYGGYNDPYNRGSRPHYRNPRNYPVTRPAQPTPQQQEQVRREAAENRQKAADQILGRRQ